ncbi:hypothetical protein ACFQV4_24540 [Streptomyces thermocarboxydus]
MPNRPEAPNRPAGAAALPGGALRRPSRTAPLVGEDTVGLRALADEPLLRYAGASPAWSAVWNADPRPDGTRWLRGPDVHDMEEILAYVRAAVS